jgi:hypothetical protein
METADKIDAATQVDVESSRELLHNGGYLLTMIGRMLINEVDPILYGYTGWHINAALLSLCLMHYSTPHTCDREGDSNLRSSTLIVISSLARSKAKDSTHVLVQR